ncbi:MAG: PIN domain-containing protein [Coleofasciculus chthonoplastes F3-SA18-01]|uniref:PIN domain-containing protein n=1 Tax=Coleofasciculus TaxID=669368 RepID=UPI0032F4B8B5
MKVILDTNLILDYALKREPFSKLADQIFILIEQKRLEGYVSASTFTDLFYISFFLQDLRSDTTYGGEGALRCANTPYT